MSNFISFIALYLFFTIFVAFIAYRVGYRHGRMGRRPSFGWSDLQLEKAECVRGDEYILTIRSGSFRGMFRGTCTVWHEYPSGKRVSTALESRLCDIWTRLRWERASGNRTGAGPVRGHAANLDDLLEADRASLDVPEGVSRRVMTRLQRLPEEENS